MGTLTPQFPQRAAFQGGGWGKGGYSMLSGWAGTGVETCALTSWFYPSPLRPGIAPVPGVAWQIGLIQQQGSPCPLQRAFKQE